MNVEIAKEPLTPEFCQQTVVNSTPDPEKFRPGSDPRAVTLFDLGVVTAMESAIFTSAVRRRIKPWMIADSDLKSSPANTVQQAADSINANAL